MAWRPAGTSWAQQAATTVAVGYQPTAATLTAQPGPTSADTVYVAEFDAVYIWTAGSITAVDGYRVIGATGGAAGRWILISGSIRLAPSRGHTWGILNAARAAMAYYGSIRLAAEAWTKNVGVTAVIDTPNGTHEIWESGATINSTISLSPGTVAQNGIWYNNGGTTAYASTSLASTTAVGSNQVVCRDATGIVVGSWIRLANGIAYTRTYRVLGKASNTLTIDRPVRRPFAASLADSGAGALTISVVAAAKTYTRTGGSFIADGFTAGMVVEASGFTNAGNNGAHTIETVGATVLTMTSATGLVNETGNNNERVIAGAGVTALAAARDITIEGNGVTITGTVDAIWQLGSGVNCHFRDINGRLTSGKFNACFDLGGRDCTARNVDIDGGGVIGSCFLVHNSEDDNLYNCRGYNAGGAGSPSPLSVMSTDNFHDWGGDYSGGVNACTLDVEDLSDPYGTRCSTFNGTAFVGASADGVLVQNGSSFNVWNGCNFDYNAAGVSFSNGATAPNGNLINGGTARNNSQAAVFAGMGTNKVIGLECAEGPVGAINVNSGAILECIGVRSSDVSAAAAAQSIFLVSGAGSVLIATACIANTNRAAHHMFETGTGSKLVVAGGTKFTASAANSIGVMVNAASVARVDEFTVVSPLGYGFYLNNAAAWCRLGSNVDVAGAGTPFFVGAGAFNRGQFNLNGAVPVAIAFGDTNAQDRLFTNLVTAGGVPTGICYAGAPVVGTGFNPVGVAGDTSLMEYEIR